MVFYSRTTGLNAVTCTMVHPLTLLEEAWHCKNKYQIFNNSIPIPSDQQQILCNSYNGFSSMPEKMHTIYTHDYTLYIHTRTHCIKLHIPSYSSLTFKIIHLQQCFSSQGQLPLAIGTSFESWNKKNHCSAHMMHLCFWAGTVQQVRGKNRCQLCHQGGTQKW